MASVTASDWKNVMNLTDTPTDTQAEYILELAIDTLNLLGAELDNMAGDAGSKTVTLTSKQRGGVFLAARNIYESFFQGLDDVGIGGLAVTAPDLMSNPVVLAFLEKIAGRLEAKADIPFVVAEDTTGYE